MVSCVLGVPDGFGAGFVVSFRNCALATKTLFGFAHPISAISRVQQLAQSRDNYADIRLKTTFHRAKASHGVPRAGAVSSGSHRKVVLEPQKTLW